MMVYIFAFPSAIFSKEIMHLKVGMRGHGQGMGEVLEQFKHPFAVFVSKLIAAVIFGDGNVEADHDEVIFRYKLQVIFQKPELILPESTPIAPAIAWIRIQYII